MAKFGLMAILLFIVMLSCITPVLGEENFGMGAEVEVEVERAEQQTIIMTDPYLPLYIIVSFMVGSIVTLLLVIRKLRRATATKGGEKFG